MTEYIFSVLENVIWDSIKNSTQEETNSEVYYALSDRGFRAVWSVTRVLFKRTIETSIDEFTSI